MTEFNLRAAVRAVIASGAVGPHAIADAVADQVANDDLRSALREALVSYARVEIAAGRRDNVILTTAGQVNSARSSKVAAYRQHGEAWRRALKAQVNTAGGYKFLGDCNYDDLMFAAGQRREIAARTLAKADQFESLAVLLRAHGVSTVSELPDTVLGGELGNAA